MNIIRGLASMVAWLIGVYSTVIVIRIIVSWILMFSRRSGWRSGYGGYGYNQQNSSTLESVDMILGKIVDPYLSMFRGVTSLKRGNMDFTPLLALVFLNLGKSIFSVISQAGSITLWLILAIIIEGLWSFVAFVMVIMLILMLVRLVVGKDNSYQSANVIDFIDPILDAPVGKVYKMFFRKKGQVEDQKLVIVSLAIYFVLFLILKAIENGLVSFLLSL